jgi:hypothetical protein
LAAAVGVPPSTVDALLNGHTKTQPTEIAEHMCQVIGVDLLILWAPTGRSVPADDEQGAAPRTAVAV